MKELEKIEILKRTCEIEISVLMDNLKKRNIIIENLQKENKMQKNRNDDLKNENKILRSELDEIKYSRSYKIVKTITKFLKRG